MQPGAEGVPRTRDPDKGFGLVKTLRNELSDVLDAHAKACLSCLCELRELIRFAHDESVDL
jgi:hypothetical protein